MATGTANRNFLGAGVAFPFSFSSSTGGVFVGRSITESEGIAHVTQSIIQILGTALGARIMRRDFGSMFRSLIMQPNDPQMDLMLDYAVRTAITKWEPRVTVGPITVDRSEKELGRLDITVSFTILKTNTPSNLVFPFYLSTADRQTYASYTNAAG